MLINSKTFESVTSKDLDAKYTAKIIEKLGDGEVTILSRTAKDCHFAHKDKFYSCVMENREAIITEITEGVYNNEHQNAFIGDAIEEMVDEVLDGKCNRLHFLIPMVDGKEKYFIEDVTTPIVENILNSMDWKDEYYPKQDEIRKALHGKNMVIRGAFDGIKTTNGDSLSETVKNNLDLIDKFVQGIRERCEAKQYSAEQKTENRGEQDNQVYDLESMETTIKPVLNALTEFVINSRKLSVEKNLQKINEAMVTIREPLKDFGVFVEYKLS